MRRGRGKMSSEKCNRKERRSEEGAKYNEMTSYVHFNYYTSHPRNTKI